MFFVFLSVHLRNGDKIAFIQCSRQIKLKCLFVVHKSCNVYKTRMSTSKDATLPDSPAIHTGRSLLSVNTESNVDSDQDVSLTAVPSVNEHRQLTGNLAMQKGGLSLLQDVTDLMLSRRHEGSGFSGRFMCSQFFNSTESLR